MTSQFEIAYYILVLSLCGFTFFAPVYNKDYIILDLFYKLLFKAGSFFAMLYSGVQLFKIFGLL